MTSVTTIPGTAAETRMPSVTLLSDGLAEAIATKPALKFDDETVSSGVRLGDAPWQVPEHVPAEWLEGGRAFMRDFQIKDVPARGFPPGLEIVKNWILQLLAGVSHSLSGDGVIARGMALRDVVEDYPVWCFTRATRIRAAKHFQFVPTAKELADFIAGIDAEIRQPARRVMAVLDAAARAPKRDSDAEPWHQRPDFAWSPEKAAERGRQIAAEKAAERKADLRRLAERFELTPMPERQPKETDEMWLARLKVWREQCAKAPDRVIGTGPVTKGEDEKRRTNHLTKPLEPADA